MHYAVTVVFDGVIATRALDAANPDDAAYQVYEALKESFLEGPHESTLSRKEYKKRLLKLLPKMYRIVSIREVTNLGV